MAYTSTPEISTYGTHKVSAVQTLDFRRAAPWFDGGSSRQDAGMVNLLPDTYIDDSGKPALRAAVRTGITGVRVTTGTNLVRGFYVWEKTVGTTYYFAVCGNNMWTSTDGTTWTNKHAVTAGSGVCRFTEFITDTNVKYLIMVDGTKAYRYVDNATYVTIDTTSDPQFPSPHVPFPVFLDGYLFLAKANTGDIYNSDLNDPTAWTAGAYISTEVYPDDIQALAKVDNYLLAIGTQSCEFFYDAANATASPLARQEGASLPFGTLIPNSIATNKNTVVMLANTNDGEYSLIKLVGFKHEELPSRWLSNAINTRMSATSGTPITSTSLRGYFTRSGGKLYYNLALQGDSSAPDRWSGTFAMSLTEGIWTELAYGTSGIVPYPVFYSAIPRSGNIATYVAGHVSGVPFVGYIADSLTSTADNITDIDTNLGIYYEIRTPYLDFGTMNRKFMNRVTLNSSGYLPTIVVGYHDWDTISSSMTDFSDTMYGADYPILNRLGTFRKRSLRFYPSSFTYVPTYLYDLEFEINKGIS